MEFSQRGFRPSQSDSAEGGSPSQASHGNKSKKKGFAWMSFSTVVLMLSVAALILAVIAYVTFGKPEKESQFVDSSKYQAVFLAGGQVYFGKINTLNSEYMTIGDIYYLRVNQQVQPDQENNQASNDVSLVKLGCELHGPQDQMVVNQDQVIFWENLKDDGQVAKAVAEYRKQNPQGQQCQTNTNNNSNNNDNNAN